tara:strand:+ start:2163 stop:2456 length:294 start_codon:yes stop_codon:yes gene_type:complete
MTSLHINIVELASKLAHEQVVNEMNMLGHAIYEFDEENIETGSYTEEAQEFFNTEYDKYWDIIKESEMSPSKWDRESDKKTQQQISMLKKIINNLNN